MIIQVVCNGLFLVKLPSHFGVFQENALILKESVKLSTAYIVDLYKSLWLKDREQFILKWPISEPYCDTKRIFPCSASL